MHDCSALSNGVRKRCCAVNQSCYSIAPPAIAGFSFVLYLKRDWFSESSAQHPLDTEPHGTGILSTKDRLYDEVGIGALSVRTHPLDMEKAFSVQKQAQMARHNAGFSKPILTQRDRIRQPVRARCPLDGSPLGTMRRDQLSGFNVQFVPRSVSTYTVGLHRNDTGMGRIQKNLHTRGLKVSKWPLQQILFFYL